MEQFNPSSLVRQILDNSSLGVLFTVTVLLLLLFIEIGYRLGRREQKQPSKAQHSQVRAIMGATLGLLAFMLAFTFSAAQSHYETRVQNMVEEARLASNAFLQAEFLGVPYKNQARKTLHEYISDRVRIDKLVKAGNIGEAVSLIDKSQNLQGELWEIAVANERSNRNPGDNQVQRDPFMVTVIGLIDIHSMRLQAAFMNRISWVIWATLILTAMLSMLVMGFQAGLVKKRSPLATVTLAIAFSAVMMLITDLDRPIMSMFKINNQVMIDLAANMAEML